MDELKGMPKPTHDNVENQRKVGIQAVRLHTTRHHQELPRQVLRCLGCLLASKSVCEGKPSTLHLPYTQRLFTERSR